MKIIAAIFTTLLQVFSLSMLIMTTSSMKAKQTIVSFHKKVSKEGRYIQLKYPPMKFHPPMYLPFEFACLPDDIIIVEVFIDTDLVQNRRIYVRTLACPGPGDKLSYMELRLPAQVTYRPDMYYPQSLNIEQGVLSAWIVKKASYEKLSINESLRKLAMALCEYQMDFFPPWERPMRKVLMPETACLDWSAEMLLLRDVSKHLLCDIERDTIDLVTYPLELSGDKYGIAKEVLLEKEIFAWKHIRAKKQLDQAKCTFSAFLYILDYCRGSLCSIIHRKTFYTNQYITPLVFINPMGYIHFQITEPDGSYKTMLSKFALPKNEWIHLVVSMKNKQWKLTTIYKNFTKVHVTGVGSPFDKDVKYDTDEGFVHIGGSKAANSFTGYMAAVQLFTRAYIDPQLQKIILPNESHPMYTLGIPEYHASCHNLQNQLEAAYTKIKLAAAQFAKRRVCVGLRDYLLNPQTRDEPTCHVKYKLLRPSSMAYLYRVLIKSTLQRGKYRSVERRISPVLMEEATSQLMRSGGFQVQKIIPLLKQASCLGNDEASTWLAAIYGAGLRQEVSENKSNLYAMAASQQGSVVAKAMLGYRHFTGSMGVAKDTDYAYRYFMKVSDKAVADKEKHDVKGVYHEKVRLSDTNVVMQQTGERGDYFQWMKFQANKGMVDAQSRVARMLFWGQQGVQRNIEAAVEMYQRNALQNPLDVVAQYDYGVILMRGQGVEKNIPLALEHLNRSAELGHGPAYTALGWYYLNFEKNNTEAAKYLEKGDALGHRDAAHNLGYMHYTGNYPGQEASRVKALKYYSKAALAGHLDAGVMLAQLVKDGNEETYPNSYLSADWARFTALQNSEISFLLRKAVDSYLANKWGESIMYYMIVAQTGVEVAQFNLAYLCEENYEGIPQKLLGKDCHWKYYQLAASDQLPHVISLLRMGDYHWFGKGGGNNTDLAIDYYVKAGAKGSVEAIFNLAYFVEHGYNMTSYQLRKIGLKGKNLQHNNSAYIAMAIYRKCRDDRSQEGYFPCGLALMRLQAWSLYHDHTFTCQLSFALMLAITIAAIVSVLVDIFVAGPPPTSRESANNPSLGSERDNMDVNLEFDTGQDGPSGTEEVPASCVTDIPGAADNQVSIETNQQSAITDLTITNSSSGEQSNNSTNKKSTEEEFDRNGEFSSLNSLSNGNLQNGHVENVTSTESNLSNDPEKEEDNFQTLCATDETSNS